MKVWKRLLVWKELGMILDLEESIHDDMPTLKFNIPKATQHDDAQHEHGVKEENVQNNTLLDVEE